LQAGSASPSASASGGLTWDVRATSNLHPVDSGLFGAVGVMFAMAGIGDPFEPFLEASRGWYVKFA